MQKIDVPQHDLPLLGHMRRRSLLRIFIQNVCFTARGVCTVGAGDTLWPSLKCYNKPIKAFMVLQIASLLLRTPSTPSLQTEGNQGTAGLGGHAHGAHGEPERHPLHHVQHDQDDHAP